MTSSQETGFSALKGWESIKFHIILCIVANENQILSNLVYTPAFG